MSVDEIRRGRGNRSYRCKEGRDVDKCHLVSNNWSTYDKVQSIQCKIQILE